MLKTYKLIPLTALDKETQLQVLEVRNEDHIRKWVFTENKISPEEHFAWIEQLKNSQAQICLVITNDETQPLGAVTIKKIDIKNKNAEIGFYKSQYIIEKGLMTNSLYASIDFSFDTLGLEKIYTEVIEGNLKSLGIHKKLLFIEEGFLRSHINRDGIRTGVHLFGLLKNDWKIGKKNISLMNNIKVEMKYV